MMVYDKPPFAVVGRKSLGISGPGDLEGSVLGAPPPDGAWAQFPSFAKANNIDIGKIKDELAKVYGPRSVCTFYGDTPVQERDQMVADFQDPDSELRFFVANPRTGGYGLTLTAATNMVYYSNQYDLEIRLQSEDRAHRIGQTKHVLYVDLVSPNTVDEKIIAALRNKIDLAQQVLGEEAKAWLI